MLIIYTNGSLIDKRIADKLAQISPNKVDITIPAMSSGAFERITQARGAQKKVFAAIDLLHQRGVNLGFKTCVLKENQSQIKAIHDFAASLGAEYRWDSLLSPRLDGSKEPYKYRGQLLAGGAPRIEYTECDSEMQFPSTQSQDLFKCGAGVSQAAITPAGELKLCLMIDYPRYKIKTSATNSADGKPLLKDAWAKLETLVTSITPDENYKCNRCNLQAYCKWCPARSWLENKTFSACDKESRQRASLIKQKAEEVEK